MNSRLKGRVKRLQLYMEKLEAKMDTETDEDKLVAYQNRYAECRQSLENIRDFGLEKPMRSAGATNIEVPDGRFTAETH